ncbi:MAG TPA: phage protein Gp27 family protein [Candidatus Binataceae bacterium]|nr:phage protein Gp27 family protein [Candidatus Binataceae bacterium]
MREAKRKEPKIRHYKWVERMAGDVREELERRLREGDFQSYRELTAWLGAHGVAVSRTSVKRYGRKFEDRLEAIRLATAQAREVCEQFSGDDATMRDALLRLVQTRLFEVLIATNEHAGKNSAAASLNLTAVARSVAGLVRAEAENRKWHERAAAVETRIDAARAEGLSENGANEIRRALMGQEGE